MRHIYLLRHAHAVPGDPGMADHDRPLSPRGHAECRVLAAWLQDRPVRPQRILCSSAIRTRETLARVSEAQADWPAPEYLPKLYLASPGELLAQLQALPESVTDVLMVGHNPGLQELALLLAAPQPGRDYDMLEIGLSTGGLIGLTAEGAWAGLAPQSARLAFYCREAEVGRG